MGLSLPRLGDSEAGPWGGGLGSELFRTQSQPSTGERPGPVAEGQSRCV